MLSTDNSRYNGGLWGNFPFFVGPNWNFVPGYIRNFVTHYESFGSKKSNKKLSPKSLCQTYMKWTEVYHFLSAHWQLKIPYLRFKYKNVLVNSRPDFGSSLLASSTRNFKKKYWQKKYNLSNWRRQLFEGGHLIPKHTTGGQLGISIKMFCYDNLYGYIRQFVLLRKQFCFREKPLPCIYTVFVANQFV